VAFTVGKLIQLVKPTNGAINISLQPTITIQFSMDMDVATISAATVKLLDSSAQSIGVSVSMDPINPTRIALITPTSKLSPGSPYQIMVIGGPNGVKSVDLGTGATTMPINYNFNFTTQTASVPDAPSLLNPSDSSIIYSAEQEFSWNAVTDAMRYELQVDNEIDFASTIFNESEINTTIYRPFLNLASPYDIPHQYYWRVRAIDAQGNPGLWSETRQFYLDDSVPEDPSTPVVESSILEIVSLFPVENSSENQALTSLSIELSASINPSSVSTNSVKVTMKDVDGGLPETLTPSDVVCSRDAVTVNFSEAIPENKEITVSVMDTILGVNGETFDGHEYKFLSKLTPYYTYIDIIKTDLGTFVDSLSEVDISKTIYKVSAWANQIAYQEYGAINEDLAGDRQQSTTNKIFYHEYVRYESELRLLLRITMERAVEFSGNKVLGDLEIEGKKTMVPDINIVIKRLEQNRDSAQRMLTEGPGTKARPVSAILGSSGDPHPDHGRGTM
jgi:hypothetical protein